MPQRTDHRNVWLDVALGNGVALLASLALCAWVSIIRVTGGAAAFHELGTSFTQVILVYLAGAPIVGTTLGILRPLLRWAVGAVLVGFLSSAPVFTAIFFLRGDLDWVGIVFCSMGVGGGIGYKFWKEFHGA